ncbi:P-loop containing nucleoside triphosphate hydrolase protein [Colletotrichum caudatum]|nr:P-loop containing nucleoside triphosphate hydrolase protein [Colletotrichum caudatum]
MGHPEYLARRLQPAIAQQKFHLADASKQVHACVTAVDLVKVFNGCSQEIRAYNKIINASADRYLGENSSTIVTMFYATLKALEGISNVLSRYVVLARGTSAGRNLRQISAAISSPNLCVGEVQVKQVSFAYPSQPHKMVLDRSSFYFPAGETRFILGRAAALGRSVTADSVRAASDMSLLQSTILSLPCGVYTKNGPSGHGLSGGQTQILALARARLRDSPVLVLDEVTSGLDRGSTLLRMDDYVYVMDRGRVVEEGMRVTLSRDPHSRFAAFTAHSDEELDHQEEADTGRNPHNTCPTFPLVAIKSERKAYTIGHRLDNLIFHHKSQGTPKPPIRTPEWETDAGKIVQSAPQNSTASRRWKLLHQCKLEQRRTTGEPPGCHVKSVWAVILTLRLIVGLVFCSVAAGCTPVFSFSFCLILVAVISGASAFLGRYLMEHVAMKGVFRQPKSWFDDPNNSASDIGECLDRHAKEMRNMVSRFIPIVTMVVVMATTSITWAMSISWKLTIVALSNPPVIITAFAAFCNEGAAETASVMHETLVNIHGIQAFTLRRHFSEWHTRLLVGWYGIYLTVANLLFFCVVSASQAVAARVLFLATLPAPMSPSKSDPGRPTSLFPITMRNVDFTYPSRCGKSTVMSLLMGLYEPSRLHPIGGIDSGQLTYEGIPSDQIYGEQFYSHISHVPHTPYLFPATVVDNIAYGLAEASPLRHRSNVRRTAREAGIHDLIMSLPRGHDTSQRVCIPRALARRPRLMIMDEPTSVLDSLSAESIRQTITGTLASAEDRGMSIVVATHSREMMRIAQYIIVMEAGRVVDEGTFHELQLRSKVISSLIHVP